MPPIIYLNVIFFVLGIDRSPYEAMFGYPARIGLMSCNLPNDEMIEVKTEEDLERIANEPIILMNIDTEQLGIPI